MTERDALSAQLESVTTALAESRSHNAALTAERAALGARASALTAQVAEAAAAHEALSKAAARAEVRARKKGDRNISREI